MAAAKLFESLESRLCFSADGVAVEPPRDINPPAEREVIVADTGTYMLITTPTGRTIIAGIRKPE